MSLIKLETDSSGGIFACPMTAFELRTAADFGLLVVIEYVETLKQLETGERKTLQAIVTPQQALNLAKALQRSASLILTPSFQTTVQ